MTGANREGDDRSLKVVSTTFEVVEELVRTDAVGVTELADELEIPKTTAHSYLKSLEHCGLAENDEGRYSASLKLLEYAGRLRNDIDLYAASRAKVDELARETGEAVNVGVRKAEEHVTVYVAEGENAIWDKPALGNRAHLNQTAIGKAILSQLPEAEVRDLVERHGLPAKTRHTITDEDELFAELATIRDQGYAVQDQEYQTSVSAIGVPVCVDGEPVGAISVTGPTSRITTNDVQEQILEQLTECVNVVEIQYEHYL